MEKSCYKKITSHNSEIYLYTFPYEECGYCLNWIPEECEKKICPKENNARWLGSKLSNNGSVIACANYGKSEGFISDLELFSDSIQTLCQTRNEVLRYRDTESIKRIRRVLHNIRSIYGHSLLEVRKILPDSFFQQPTKSSLNDATQYFLNQPYNTTKSILEIAKDLFSIKTEFSVYDKLIKGDVPLNKQQCNLRKVLLTVMYPFYNDFSSKDVFVKINSNNSELLIDFETMQIAFYHIIENTAKYVMPHTHIIIDFPSDNIMQKVEFEMISLYIKPDEVEKIFEENYSGQEALCSGLNGEGIGLYRSRKLVELNNGKLIVDASDDYTLSPEKIKYALNKFIVSIPIQ